LAYILLFAEEGKKASQVQAASNPTACWTEGPWSLIKQYKDSVSKSAYQKEKIEKLKS